MDNAYNLKPHEEMFELHPYGVRYKCEFCNEGEQVVVKDEVITVPLVMKVGNSQSPIMRKHRCNKCGKEMMLPKSYPYIEWKEGPVIK